MSKAASRTFSIVIGARVLRVRRGISDVRRFRGSSCAVHRPRPSLSRIAAGLSSRAAAAKGMIGSRRSIGVLLSVPAGGVRLRSRHLL